MLRLKHKLIMYLVLTSFISLSILLAYNSYDTIRKNEADVKEYRQTLIEQFDRKVKSQVEAAHSLIADIHKKQQQGALAEPDARKLAADMVRGMRFEGDNYFWIDTAEGINVVYLGREEEGKSRRDATDPLGKKFIQEIITNGMQAGGGYTDYAFAKPGETKPLPKRSYSLIFQPYQWVIGTGNWIDDIDQLVAAKALDNSRKLKETLVYSVAISLFGLVIAAIAAFFIGSRIAKPVTEIAGSAEEIAQGNLSGADPVVSSQDEIGMLSQSFILMKQQLRDLIRQVDSSASQVAAASEELTATAEQAAMAANQVAESISEVAAGAERQVKSVDDTAGVISRMSEEIRDIAGKVRNVAGLSDQTADTAAKGKTAVESAIVQMRNIEKSTEESAGVVAKLGERSREIGQIVDAITGIAGQTNLLALNAAIEAARAGEAGRGFAVVAEEVRKLAEEAEDAAKRIASLVREIQADTASAVAAMDAGTQEVKYGAQVVAGAAETFTQINEMVNGVSSQAEAVSAAVQRLTVDSRQIVGEVDAIERISRDTAAETETVSAATEQQSASFEEIASASQALAHLAEQLQTALQRFKV